MELVSDGNYSLVRAVEKFDYTKGFRFGTYATWIISKNFARKIPAEAGRQEKSAAAELANVEQYLRTAEAADFAAVEKASKSLVDVIGNELNKREQYIILNHFGLLGTLVRKETKTLKQIGEDLSISK